jgi:hypothetical protein
MSSHYFQQDSLLVLKVHSIKAGGPSSKSKSRRTERYKNEVLKMTEYLFLTITVFDAAQPWQDDFTLHL